MSRNQVRNPTYNCTLLLLLFCILEVTVGAKHISVWGLFYGFFFVCGPSFCFHVTLLLQSCYCDVRRVCHVRRANVPTRCISIHISWLLRVKLQLGQFIHCYTVFSEIPKWCAAISHQRNSLYVHTLGKYLFLDIGILQKLTCLAEIN